MTVEFLLIFFVSVLFVWGMKHYSPRIGLVDIPNIRSSHNDVIPRGGGVGFTMAVWLLLPFICFSVVTEYFWTFIAIFLVLIVGFLDDHRDTSPNTKFIVIILATILIYFDNIVIDDIGVFFGWHLQLGWLALPFTALAVVGFTNALNLIDGLDGLAAGISIVIFTSLFSVGYMHDDTFITCISLAFIAALSAFLLFNWNPASIFMGDSGSLVLGFVIAVLSVKALAYIPAVSILFLAAIPNMDVMIILVRRKMHGHSAFAADKCHFHHILHQFFSNNTKKTVFFLIVLQVIYSMTGLQLDKNIDEGYLLVLFILNTVMLYLILSTMIKRQKRDC
ncbi:MraY family glycosyltransferase [Sulfurovum sp. NBC37-1]|uniref:MraY family glycosyltransferase n=1 Tax=Sulfurovum sp. (strain NBC37-1) TaxID=387093 RepID=UPI0001587BAA|nr:MraY family glycosyltransferase [Sulfurovum sp. NBC37-1]BAF72506.1 glycosyl transferase [Sulfurovum sp. NBC37-1]